MAHPYSQTRDKQFQQELISGQHIGSLMFPKECYLKTYKTYEETRCLIDSQVLLSKQMVYQSSFSTYKSTSYIQPLG